MLTPETKSRWNALILKLQTRIGKPPTLSPADLEWLERISAAAVGFDRLANSVRDLISSHPALLNGSPGMSVASLLNEYGYQINDAEN